MTALGRRSYRSRDDRRRQSKALLAFAVAAAITGSTVSIGESEPAGSTTPGGSVDAWAPPASGGERYPLEVAAPFHTALFHWLDSLVGTSRGKTIPLHRQQFMARFVEPGSADKAVMRAFKDIRVRHSESWTVRPDAPEDGAIRRGQAAMLKSFLETDDLSGALDRLDGQIARRDAVSLRTSLMHFEPRYRKIWYTADHLRRFVRDLKDPSALGEIEEFLVEMASFFDVSPTDPPRPRLVLVPVPGGGGTHAQAIGRFLLLEIRPGDSPRSQFSVIAHENAHFLWSRMPEKRRNRLESVANGHGEAGLRAWKLLHEALPTALGQGVAKSRHWPQAFSRDINWYHRAEIDSYAKAIYPLVRDALRDGRTLDERLVGELVRVAHEGV